MGRSVHGVDEVNTMIQLTPKELEEILDNVQDVKQRATAGIERMPEGTPQAQKYVEQFLTDIKTNPGTHWHVHESDGMRQAVQAIQKAPREAQPALLEDYVQWQMQNAPKETITKTISLIAQILCPRKNGEGTIEQTENSDEYTRDIFRRTVLPTIKELLIARRASTTTADDVVFSLAKSLNSAGMPEDFHEELVRYARQRADSVQQPKSLSDVHMRELYSLMELLEMPFSDEFNQLYVATSFFEDRWMSSEDKRPKRTDDNLAQAVSDAWNIAQQLWKTTGTSQIFYALFNNEYFQKKYTAETPAPAIAKDLVLNMLREQRFDDAKTFAKAYGITTTSQPGITSDDVADVIKQHILNGHYQFAQDISKHYGCEITQDMITQAAAHFSQQVREHASAERIDDAITTRQQRKALDEFAQHGLDVARIPAVGISENYSGKILLMNFQEKTFIRGVPPHKREGMHEHILQNFREEVRIHGYHGYPEEKGGAHIGFSKENPGVRIIHGKSGDYGECDKDLAAKLLKEAFPTQNITVEWEQRR